jgi:flagellar hook-associated protein 1
MGLISSLENSVTGLNINQQQLNTLSQNISNANTPNYSNEVVNQQALFTAGMAQGVSVASIQRQIDTFLTTEVRNQTTASNTDSTVQNYYNQVENLFGQPGTNSTLDQNVSTFFTALQTLANTPSVSAETAAVNAGKTIATQLSGLANSIEGMRLQADGDISTAISTVNSDLTNLNNLNTALTRAAATNQNPSGLLDQRDATLADIAQYIDINPTFDQAGTVSISTTNGVTLLTVGNLGQLSYTPATSVQTFISNGKLSPVTVTLTDDGGRPVGTPATLVTGGVSGTSGSITTLLAGGKISGLLQVRDQVLPDILSQLDQFAGTLRDQVNTVNNAGTGFPPPNSYTGVRLVTGNQTSQYSGSVRIAALNADGSPIISPYPDEPNGVQPLTLDLTTLNYGNGNGILSVDNIISAINQYYGPPQNKAEIGNLNNVQLQMAASSVPTPGNTVNFGFSLNNISASDANFYVSGITVFDNTGATMSSTTTAGVASTIPQTALSTYQATAANTVTITTAGPNNLTDGEIVYLSPPTAPGIVGGVSTASMSGGYFTVSNVTGTTFDITVAGVVAGGGTVSAAGASEFPPYATDKSGATISTISNGSFNADISANTASPFYTVQANIATVDANGNVKTSTVTYRVVNATSGVLNNIIGATSANGNGAIVQPTSTQPFAVASLVDANGNPLPKTSNAYGFQQGFLKIAAFNSKQSVAIDSLDSQELGQPYNSIPLPGTNQGFSQYFGLNDFFVPNKLTTTGDSTANSALNLAVESRILANPNLISTASLAPGNQPTAASAAPNFTYRVNSGDNSTAQKLAGLATATVTFSAAGSLPQSSTTFGQYVGQVIANTSTNSTNATNTANDSQALLEGFTKRAQTVSGVNLDQELANTVIYQNSYTASARVISVIGTMFDALMTIVQ